MDSNEPVPFRFSTLTGRIGGPAQGPERGNAAAPAIPVRLEARAAITAAT